MRGGLGCVVAVGGGAKAYACCSHVKRGVSSGGCLNKAPGPPAR